jgi:hypothetical protein
MKWLALLVLTGCAATPAPVDAGACNHDLFCDPGETCASCTEDCGPCTGCPDGVCLASAGETCWTCPYDCGHCDAATR